MFAIFWQFSSFPPPLHFLPFIVHLIAFFLSPTSSYSLPFFAHFPLFIAFFPLFISLSSLLFSRWTFLALFSLFTLEHLSPSCPTFWSSPYLSVLPLLPLFNTLLAFSTLLPFFSHLALPSHPALFSCSSSHAYWSYHSSRSSSVHPLILSSLSPLLPFLADSSSSATFRQVSAVLKLCFWPW